MRRRSTKVVAAGAAAFAAIALTGCGSDPDPDYQGVCVDQQTETRVADEECDDESRASTHGFVFFPLGLLYPAIGGRLRNYPGYTANVPAGHNGAIGGASASGGVVSKASAKAAAARGGFGTTGRGGGSVGG